jgi:hypothetical protein
MQETKRRGKKGVILLALVVALLLMAIVPGVALGGTPPAPSQLMPYLDFTNGTSGTLPAGVLAQGNYYWFASNPSADYYALMNGVDNGAWTGIPVPALSGGGTLNVGTIVYKVGGKPIGGIAVPVGAYPTNIMFNTVTGAGAEGIHTVESWLKETTATAHALVEKPIVTDHYGIDTTKPEWQHLLLNGIDVTDPANNTCWWNIPVKFSAFVTDPAGSGVAPTPTASWDATSSATNGHPAFQLAWDQFTWEVTGTVLVPAAPAISDSISLVASDYVGNMSTTSIPVNFDTVAPHTSYTISPAGADTQAGWTNKPVTVTFKSADNSPGAGVAYTEYVVKTSTTSAVPPAPGINDSGSKGTTVTVSTTAPIGPTYIYYRSVDKACPTGNKEAWNLVMVFFDNVPPALSDTIPSWWINGGGEDISIGNFRGGGCFEQIIAIDHNSGIAPPGITWTIEGHDPPFGGTNIGPDVFIPILPLALGDGIRNLNYSAIDKAGNKASNVTPIKIDTRPPSTDGASGWVNGTVPYVLTATDQVPGAGVAATVYRVDQKTPWSVNSAVATATPTLATSITWTSPKQGDMHTIDFASVDAALPCDFDPVAWKADFPGVPTWHLGNWELDILNILSKGAAYKSRTVMLDVTAPTVKVAGADDAWHNSPVTLNFSATDVGSGVDHIEWSIDGTNWTIGNSAVISKNGVVTVSYRAVDKVGLVSATQTVTVKVSTTPPVVTGGGNVSVQMNHKAMFTFTVAANTPTCVVRIQITSKANGHVFMNKNFSNVPTGSAQTRGFKITVPAGKYNIRIGATDQAHQVQVPRAVGTLTVTK